MGLRIFGLLLTIVFSLSAAAEPVLDRLSDLKKQNQSRIDAIEKENQTVDRILKDFFKAFSETITPRDEDQRRKLRALSALRTLSRGELTRLSGADKVRLGEALARIAERSSYPEVRETAGTLVNEIEFFRDGQLENRDGLHRRDVSAVKAFQDTLTALEKAAASDNVCVSAERSALRAEGAEKELAELAAKRTELEITLANKTEALRALGQQLSDARERMKRAEQKLAPLEKNTMYGANSWAVRTKLRKPIDALMKLIDKQGRDATTEAIRDLDVEFVRSNDASGIVQFLQDAEQGKIKDNDEFKKRLLASFGTEIYGGTTLGDIYNFYKVSSFDPKAAGELLKVVKSDLVPLLAQRKLEAKDVEAATKELEAAKKIYYYDIGDKQSAQEKARLAVQKELEALAPLEQAAQATLGFYRRCQIRAAVAGLALHAVPGDSWLAPATARWVRHIYEGNAQSVPPKPATHGDLKK